jgi:hypothetical protein
LKTLVAQPEALKKNAWILYTEATDIQIKR